MIPCKGNGLVLNNIPIFQLISALLTVFKCRIDEICEGIKND